MSVGLRVNLLIDGVGDGRFCPFEWFIVATLLIKFGCMHVMDPALEIKPH